MTSRRFDRVLVANRGEIALRVIRACRTAGLASVAVYSDADLEAPHTRAADTAIRIGPAPALESYLSIPNLIAAAQRTGVQAIHPGYGFLSERSAFARAVTDAGLIFIGPSAEVIELLGRKDSSRQVAIAAGVPVIPAAVAGNLAERALDEIGLPLLVKAAAGGGGRGMRIVRVATELAEAIAAAKREAAAAFGDDTVLIERYVERGRHVEVQIIADEHGSVLHLFERDCSTQRRHQKVLEEAPAPTISAELRETITTAAVSLARSAGYVNAGTVEFLVDGEQAYLLEMNTRLQVEHPVTEFITGRDLVQLQLLVAQGETLPFSQVDITAAGHSIEARVYAEDADAGFLPQAGRASAVRWPASARVDAALGSGQSVGTWYDPMLGKVIVHGPNRQAARQALVAALDETVILGLTTNVSFLRRLVDSAEFRDCEIDTAWLDRNPDPFGRLVPAVFYCAAAWSQRRPVELAAGPFGSCDGWRVAGPAAPLAVALELDGDTSLVTVNTAGQVHCDKGTWQVRQVQRSGPDRDGLVDLVLEIDGLSTTFIIAETAAGITVVHHGQQVTFGRRDQPAAATQEVSDGQVTAPMPGVVRAIHVTAGQQVNTGDVLGMMEAMKMELSLTAPFAGTLTAVTVGPGDQVGLGQVLFTVTAEEAA